MAGNAASTTRTLAGCPSGASPPRSYDQSVLGSHVGRVESTSLGESQGQVREVL